MCAFLTTLQSQQEMEAPASSLMVSSAEQEWHALTVYGDASAASSSFDLYVWQYCGKLETRTNVIIVLHAIG
jgi:hypothetical protein